MKLILFIFSISLSVNLFGQNVYYASSKAQKGVGSRSDPFEIQYAFSGGGGIIKDLDTVKLINDGNYKPVVADAKYLDYVVYMSENPYDPVTILGLEDETTLKGIVTFNKGYFYTLYALNIKGNNPNRDGRVDGYKGAASGIYFINASNVKIINCQISKTTASGIYKGSLGRNVTIDGNRIYDLGFFSKSKNRLSHHGLYIQNWEGSVCLIQNNLVRNAAQYGIQAWHQNANEATKLHSIKILDNTFYKTDQVALHYGGYSISQEGAIIGNSVFGGEGFDTRGIRMGYSQNGNAYNTSFSVDNNFVQDANIMIHNVKSSIYSISENIVIREGKGWSFMSFYEKDRPEILSKTIDNFTYTNSSVAATWLDYNWDGTKSYVNYRDDPVETGEEFSYDQAKNFIKYVHNKYDKRVYVTVHNPEKLDKIIINLDKTFSIGDKIKVFDFENMSEPILKQVYNGSLELDMNLSVMEPIYGNLPVPKTKTSKKFNVFEIRLDKATDFVADTPPQDPIDDGPEDEPSEKDIPDTTEPDNPVSESPVDFSEINERLSGLEKEIETLRFLIEDLKLDSIVNMLDEIKKQVDIIKNKKIELVEK